MLKNGRNKSYCALDIPTLIILFIGILIIEYRIYKIRERKQNELYSPISGSKIQDVSFEADPFYRKWSTQTCEQCTLKEASFLISPRCLNRTNLIILINSHPANSDKRKAIRETWASVLPRFHMQHFFVFGVSYVEAENKLIQKEADEFGDVIQADFMEQYRNLNLKTVSGLKWITQRCTTNDYVFKTDDDMFIDPYTLSNKISSGEFSNKNIYGNCMSSGYVHRGVHSKWYAPYRFYPHQYYGAFCLGSAFIMTHESAEELYNAAKWTHFFHVEDVYISALVRANAKLTVQSYPGIHMSKQFPPKCSRQSKYIASLLSDVQSFYELWKEVQQLKCHDLYL